MSTATVEERFGPYGGRFVPETLIAALDELSAAWAEARVDEAFQRELGTLLRDYVGRPRRCIWRSASPNESGVAST